ncbi:MAG: hypothetical protein ACLUD2_03195 [Clostridium sp.]
MITFFCWGSIYIVSKYALAVMEPVTVGILPVRGIGIMPLWTSKLKGGAKKIQRYWSIC